MNRFNNFSSQMNVVVVGATGGIGNALIEALLDEPRVAQIFAFSRCTGNAHAALCSERVIHGFVDLEKEASIEQAGKTLRDTPIDLVVVASGLLHDGNLRPEKALKQLSQDSLQRVFQINAIAPMLLAKAILPHMRSDTRSVFGVLSARVGSISDNRLGGWHSYRSSKSALNMFLKTAAIGSKMLQPNCVIVGLHPGTVDTQLSAPFQRNVKPEKLFSPQQSANYLLDVISDLIAEDSGKVFAWDGEEIAP
ncbi:SDR family NAD(P)-dependent oxidoreductase [Neptunomonas marina]|nr:SDR family NAD(P)-dependent oxidoreductase [Neptunomonas marina]